MSTNAYRQTEPFFRRLEAIIDLSTKGQPQDFLVSSEEWTPATYAVNLRFAINSFLLSVWESYIDRQKLRERRDRYLLCVIEPTALNQLRFPAVGWKLRQTHPVESTITTTTHRAPIQTKLPYEFISQQVTKMTAKRIPLTTELLTSVVRCLQSGCLEQAIPLWGTLLPEYQDIVKGTGVYLTPIVDPVNGEHYVLVN